MEDTIEDKDVEIEQKDNKTEFLEKEIGLPVSKVFEEMKKQGLANIPTKKK